MPFWFTCTYCDSQTLVEDRLEGQAGTCATCGKAITVHRPPRATTSRNSTVTHAPSPRAILSMIAILTAGMLLIGASSWVVLTLVIPRLTPIVASHRLQTAANLTRIGTAMRTYHQFHGSLPPAYFSDEQGVPTHSWRAMILPFLGEEGLAAAYRWDEPWNGPHNSQLISRMPEVFASPSDIADRKLGVTSFLAITGPETPFPAPEAIRLSDIMDALEDTILVVESADSETSWLEPKDIPVSRMTFQVNQEPQLSIRSRDPSGPHILLADGTVRRLRDSVPPRILQGLTTIRGFEWIDWSMLEAR